MTDFIIGVDWGWWVVVGIVSYLVGMTISSATIAEDMDDWELFEWSVVVLWPITLVVLLCVGIVLVPAVAGRAIHDAHERREKRKVNRGYAD